MIDATNAVKIAAIGGTAAVSCLIYYAVFKGTIKPIRKFHLQRKEDVSLAVHWHLGTLSWRKSTRVGADHQNVMKSEL
jgi:hypothetical protein